MERVIESRSFYDDSNRPQVREGANGERSIYGTASSFNVIYDIGGIPGDPGSVLFREVIRPGAFTKTLREARPFAVYWNHDHNQILGRTNIPSGQAGHAEIWADERGLHYDVPDVGNRQWAKDAVETTRMGLQLGSSLGYWPIKDRWTEEKGKPPLREILELSLDHVSPVGTPANPRTSASVREEIRSAVLARENLPESVRKRLEEKRNTGEDAGGTNRDADGDVGGTKRNDASESGESTTQEPDADHSEEREAVATAPDAEPVVDHSGAGDTCAMALLKAQVDLLALD